MIFVLDDDLGLTKKVNPCILVPPANSRNTFKTTISNWNGMQHDINFYLILHTGYFLELLNKNYLRKNPNCRYQQVKNMKIKGTIVISILKVNETIVPIFFLIFSGCYLKLKFALNTFWIKISKISNCVRWSHYLWNQMKCVFLPLLGFLGKL